MRLLMMGTGEFAEPTFQTLIESRHEVVGLVTNPDRPKGKKREMMRSIKEIALAHHIPVFQPESVNSPEGLDGVRRFNADLFVVAAYGQILSKALLELPKLGGINVHASLLPKYRGAAPINWAIYHGETETGVTIIRMTPRLDAGEMLAHETVPIGPDEPAGELEERLAPIGASAALRIVDELAKGPVTGVQQDPALVTKAPKLTKDHGLVNWTRTAGQVCNQIRAMQPWPKAYTYWLSAGGPPMRWIISKALVTSEAFDETASGTIAKVDRDDVIVQAGSGGVSLLEVQPAGKRPMKISEFLRGHKVCEGDRLGSENGHAN